MTNLCLRNDRSESQIVIKKKPTQPNFVENMQNVGQTKSYLHVPIYL